MGLTGTLLIYVGAIAFVLDRWLLQQYAAGRVRRSAVSGRVWPVR
jgi:hypothetical protein